MLSQKYTCSSSWYHFLHLTVNLSHVSVMVLSFFISLLEAAKWQTSCLGRSTPVR
jgi:hypothetical protein